MRLNSYIEDLTPKKFSELYGICFSQACNLMNMKNAPEPRLAYKVVRHTHGLVSWAEIYEPIYDQEVEKDDSQLGFNI